MAKKRKLNSKTSPATTKEPSGSGPKDDGEFKDEDEPFGDEPLQQPLSASSADRPLTADVPPVEQDQQLQSSVPDQEPQFSVSAGDAASAFGNGFEDDVEEEKDPASIQKLLEPFPKDLLVELLRDAAVKHPDVLGEILRIADADPAHCKIFVHGLGWDTTRESLKAAFLQYGEIEDCNAVIDKVTGKSKGYGFILFKHRDGARRALKQPQKKIGSRMTACQLASAGPAPPAAPPVAEYTQKKIFVSNVGAELDPEKLLQFFSKFGEIEEGPLGLDKATGKPKGFALFIYKTVESAKKALEEPHKNFEGHILHCQKAIDGPKPNKTGYQFHGAGGQHGGLHHGAGGVGVLGSHYPRADGSGFSGGAGNHVNTRGHLMAPPASGLGFNQAAQPAAAAAAAGLSPALGQALSTLLATQGAGLGLTNILGNLGSSGMGAAGLNTGVATSSMANSSGHGIQVGYGNQASVVAGNLNSGIMGGYGTTGAAQGGYGNMAMGQGGAGRNQQGLGHMGGVGHYLGH